MTEEKLPSPEKKNFWQRITAPHPSIENFAERRYASVLATLLLALLPLYYLPEVLRAILERYPADEIAYFGVGVLVLALSYGLARSPKPRWGAGITTLYFMALPFVSLVVHAEHYAGENADRALIWSVPIMLLALILFRPKDVKWFVLLQVGLYLIIPAFWDKLTYAQVFSTLWLVIAVGGLMIVSAFVQRNYLRRVAYEAEKTLRSEERYKELFLTSPVALLEADFSAIKTRLDAFAAEHGDVKSYILAHPESMKGAGRSVRLLDANWEAQRIYEAEDLPSLLESLTFAVSPREMLALRDGVIALWEGKSNQPIETVHRTLKKNKRNVVVRFTIRSGAEETWEYVNVAVSDVTEQRETEATMRLLASAVEASASSVVMTDMDGAIEYVNPAFQQKTGYSAEEALGQNPRILKSGAHSPEFYEEMWATLAAGKVWQGEILNKKKNGEHYWEMATISPVRNSKGSVRHYVAVKDDISRLKNAEEQIRQQSEFLESVMNGIDSPFYVLDVEDYSVVMANEVAKREGIAEAKTCYAMTHHLDAPCNGKDHPCPLQQVLATRKPFTVEHKHYRKDGTFYDAEVHGYPIFDARGNIIQMIEYSLDISARKKAERRAKRLLQEQISVRRALEAIASSLDINTVLHQIAQEIRHVVNATSAYIWRWNSDTYQGFVVAENFSPEAGEYEKTSSLGQEYVDHDPVFIEKMKTNQHIIGHVGETYLSAEYERYLREREVISLLYIPIRWQNDTIAFVEIWESRLRRDFTPDEIILCQHIAENAAVALNNASNYKKAQLEIERRKEVERELRKLANATEQTASGIVITNKDSIIEFANPAAARITGYAIEELLGQTPNILKSGVHDESFYENLWQTIERGDTWRGELVNRRKDGSFYWESQIITPVKNSAGEVTHYVAVKEDVTQAKEDASRIRTLTNAIEQTANGIVVTDMDGRIEFSNSAFSSMSGYSLDEIIGKTTEELQRSDEHEPAFYELLNEKIARGEIWKGEIINRRKDGSLYWEALVISPVKDDDGVTVNRVEVKEDVTLRKELEQALALAHEEALIASEMKTQLLANVSHDMRTPLGAILGYTEMLSEGVFDPLNEKQAEATRAIAASSQRLLNFVTDLLNQAQIETGKIVLKESFFKPAQIIDSLGGEISLARTRGMTITTLIDENLPPVMIGDAYWLGQIMHNLLSNAIKFTPEDGEINVELLRTDEESWCMRVADNGNGIPEEAQQYIFESFRQVDGSPSRESHKGSGLGLSIVQHLVQLMNGEIKLESELGKGSVFSILLPLKKTEENEK